MNERDNIETLTDPVDLVNGLRAMGYSSGEIRRMAQNVAAAPVQAFQEETGPEDQAPTSEQATAVNTPYRPLIEINSRGQVVRVDLGAKDVRLGGTLPRRNPDQGNRNWTKK